MIDQLTKPLWVVAAGFLAAAALFAGLWGPRAVLGVAAGGAWNLTSLWCLMRLMQAWLGPHPSRTRAIVWLLVKFPLLYLLAVVCLSRASISLVGFGIGFSVVLMIVLGWFASPFSRVGARS